MPCRNRRTGTTRVVLVNRTMGSGDIFDVLAIADTPISAFPTVRSSASTSGLASLRRSCAGYGDRMHPALAMDDALGIHILDTSQVIPCADASARTPCTMYAATRLAAVSTPSEAAHVGVGICTHRIDVVPRRRTLR
jgi:hypothetical protein